jgi:hypothetical protein
MENIFKHASKVGGRLVCDKFYWMVKKLEFSGRIKLNRLSKHSFDGNLPE